MAHPQTGSLIRLRPQPELAWLHHGRTLLVTDPHGNVTGATHGLFVRETRIVARYCWRINGREPLAVAVSDVSPHSWLGYFIVSAPRQRRRPARTEAADAARDTLELRLSRFVGCGMHEDVEVTNFTQYQAELALELEVAADFADLQDSSARRKQPGKVACRWESLDGGGQLECHYHAEHRYAHGTERGTAAIDRSAVVRVQRAGSPPLYAAGRIAFQITLPPQGRWQACVLHAARFEDGAVEPLYGCRAFDGGPNEWDRRRALFLDQATKFTASEPNSLSAVVTGALAQAKRDLAALRFYELDHGEHAWTMAAGLPQYVALFGRDTLNTARRTAMAGTGALRGTLRELARWQGRVINDWRDEQPGRMLHEAHTGPLAVLNVNPRQRYYGSATELDVLEQDGPLRVLRQPLPWRWLDAASEDLDGAISDLSRTGKVPAGGANRF